ncbi:MAG: hypothetical protein WCK02_06675 [Bacteroidota bacterium]
MKFKKTFSAIAIAICYVVLASSCERENEARSSESGEDSHNTGVDCMICHKKDGNGKGIFTVAGTVYDSIQKNIVTGATVRLYSGANATGTLLATIPNDQSGNFYISNTIDFTKDVYVSVKSRSGNIKEMNGKIKTGACTSCHGTTTDVVWVK